jgi:molybdenum cofactor guanylyltransferase
VGNGSPIGAILAGGRGARLGGAKALTELGGRPLIAWPLAALAAALDDVVVVAKADTPLPELDVEVWTEPEEPAHPRAGIVHALSAAGERAVLVCAADMPFVTPELVADIAAAEGMPAVVPRAAGRLQPLLARYEPAALLPLRAAPAAEALTATVESLRPRLLDYPEETAFFNVNSAADLASAAQRIARKQGNSRG